MVIFHSYVSLPGRVCPINDMSQTFIARYAEATAFPFTSDRISSWKIRASESTMQMEGIKRIGNGRSWNISEKMEVYSIYSFLEDLPSNYQTWLENHGQFMNIMNIPELNRSL